MDVRPPDHVTRWLGPSILIAVAGFLFFSIPLSREALCEPEKNCLLSWISALSGWGAVGAAIATIAFIQRQIADTNRHHREMLALELQPKLALANRTRIDAGRVRMVANELTNEVASIARFPLGWDTIVKVEIAPRLRILSELINASSFTSFEDQIGSLTPFGLDEAQQNVRVLLDKFDVNFTKERFEGFGEVNVVIALHTMSRTVDYSNFCEGAAVEFEKRWRALING